MPGYTTFGHDPYPTGPEAAWVPGSMMAYGESIDPKLVHTVTTQAQRDSDFNGLPAGRIVTCPLLKTIWMSLGETSPGVTGWDRVYYEPAIATTGFTWATNFSTAGNTTARRSMNTVEIVINATYSGAGLTAGAAGTLADTAVVTVPPAFVPPLVYRTTSFRTPFAGGTAEVRVPDGVVYLTDMHSTSTISPGEVIRLNFTFLGA